MKNIFIIYRSMFTQDGDIHTIGGIENYILNLIRIFKAQGWLTQIVQPSKKTFKINGDGYSVNGIDTGFYRGNSKKYALAKWVKQHATTNDIVIFATDSYAVRMTNLSTVGIQHGVSWDKPRRTNTSAFQFISSLLNHYKYLQYARKSDALVCVDHNFVNWYRTWLDTENKYIRVIYNFFNEKLTTKQIIDKWQLPPQIIKIIIARRFVDYRGIDMIAPVIQRLLQQFSNIEVTFAGEGSLQPKLEHMFATHNRVTITQYQAQDSFLIHQQHHIALIPTLGSEGTSLAMLEAMAAGCLVISSNVGGLTNIILNGYNGHMVMPNAQEFESTISQAITNMEQSKTFAIHGYNSIEQICSVEQWGKSWVEVIEQLSHKA
ncbi:glycosyltransferase family 4 protein [Shewanella sp. 10N.286.52.B9]|uniref:glycosyltransferase family 4 protein n=1 Tax=Shewanella sp. 10N.286.52.B9 TaxID=1880837 RepID=UPI000C8232AD|nr:glycosyltransferase family 4 protein [Shewanella sp. 10N.286.52.B9]PMG52451.1 glycosyl transferase family 1 [Shewanella sp. 10N.286.52.B9]